MREGWWGGAEHCPSLSCSCSSLHSLPHHCCHARLLVIVPFSPPGCCTRCACLMPVLAFSSFYLLPHPCCHARCSSPYHSVLTSLSLCLPHAHAHLPSLYSLPHLWCRAHLPIVILIMLASCLCSPSILLLTSLLSYLSFSPPHSCHCTHLPIIILTSLLASLSPCLCPLICAHPLLPPTATFVPACCCPCSCSLPSLSLPVVATSALIHACHYLLWAIFVLVALFNMVSI